MLGEGRVGAWALSDGATHEVRLGNTGELIIGDAHARFYEAVKRGNVYTFGVSNTAIAAVNAVATTGATAKPMIGLWNPSTSLVNLVVLKAIAIETTIPASAVSPAGLMWTYSVGNSAISTGGTPINAKTLLAAGSAAKAFAMATALTGMSGALAVLRAAAIVTRNIAAAATSLSFTGTGMELVDGSLIVPPGAVLALQSGVDASSNAASWSTGIVWEEVAL